MNSLPHLPLGEYVDDGIRWIKDNMSGLLDSIKDSLEFLVEGLSDWLLTLPSLIVVILFALLGTAVRSVRFGIFALLGTGLIVSMELWEPAMQTLAMVLVATFIAVLIAVPVGVLAARNNTVSAVVRPVLDLMQTMPALVYLVPVVIFFSIGYAPGVVATIVFSMAPGVRLTELGIRQVDKETVEAGQAFGGTPWQILRGIQLPLGLPTIMAGVNQVIMLALSMAVMAGFVGADGLGKIVVESLSRVNVAVGFEAGLAIVILAIFLDRLTGAIGQPTGRSFTAFLRRRRQAAERAASERAATEEVTAGRDATSLRKSPTVPAA
ncbi:proline/glycine betaine ABC transporter permease [Streptomyces sp. DSM 44915]|uniref:Proline/glycine betaine ABC transporter permease n=1 Tax=Streptomyces chisholmiae TaxID=3075540 RepID=A0ABU2JY37_9ACTN|nr:proline/glycine betaine ABC transporter permease [Streptomyces sp. DSM 44915]MDT0269907.1 proline/glycine betaine ABC transporter permease [Streptomyces sp. DSM 44915]